MTRVQGLTQVQYSFLVAIKGAGGRLTSTEAATLSMPRRTRFGAARALEQAGLIRVARSLRDTRVRVYILRTDVCAAGLHNFWPKEGATRFCVLCGFASLVVA